MRILVTGASGFVGSHLVRRLLRDGHDITGTRGGASASHEPLLTDAEREAITWLPLDLTDRGSVERAASGHWDAVVHLAAIAWSREAGKDPGHTWNVNAGGTARLMEAVGRSPNQNGSQPLVLLVSTAEVYGQGRNGPRLESDALAPLSAYAASKVGAEFAALEAARRGCARVIIARPFPHTGPGQHRVFVIPAFIERLRLARRANAPVVKVGNLETVRDFLDVRDVVEAYAALLERGIPGEVYNIASGTARTLHSIFDQISRLLDTRALPELDAAFMRPWDVPHLVGDATKLRQATGWIPRIRFEQTLSDMIDAQAD